MVSIQARIAEELGVKEQQVQAAVELLDGGATVPFIARYRKEVTGSLDDAQLRTLEERGITWQIIDDLSDIQLHRSHGPKILVLEGRGRPEMRGKYSRFGEPVPAQLTRLERLGQRS